MCILPLIAECVCVCVCGFTNMWYPGMCVCPSVLLCGWSLMHTSLLSLQLLTLLHQLKAFVCVCVCVCTRPASLRSKSRPGRHPPQPVWGDLEWRLLPVRAMYHFQRGVCASISVSFQQHTNPRLGLSRLPLVCLVRSLCYVCALC